MVAVCFYFQVHQPFRIKKYRIFDIGKDKDYFGDKSESKLNNEKILWKVANKCYLPANAVLLDVLTHNPDFKCSFSFSGVFLEQCEKYAPAVIESFKKLVDTGRVEVLEETYYHSLAFLHSKEEFREQVKMHKEIVQRIFGVTPTIFRNTELIYNNELAKEVADMGYKGIIAEGADHILGWRSPNFVYKPVSADIALLLKNYKLSDDVAFRFSNRGWEEWPLTAPKYSQWVNAVNGNGYVINLFMDYETFGEHQWEDTGIFEFMRAFPYEHLKHPDNSFKTPSEVAKEFPKTAELDYPYFVSWADIERDLSAWLSNRMQHSAMNNLYSLRHQVLATKDPELIDHWRKMQTSDNFYYMCTKWFSDGDVHKYFNPYETPYDAFIAFMNVFQDLKLRIAAKNEESILIPDAKVYKEQVS